MKKTLREIVNFLFVLSCLAEWPFVLLAAWISDQQERKFRVVGPRSK